MSQPPIGPPIIPKHSGWYWVRMPCGDHIAFVNVESGRVILLNEDNAMVEYRPITAIQDWVHVTCPFDQRFDPDRDYPTAARSIALNLAEFCDNTKPYPRMISDAAREAANQLSRARGIAENAMSKYGSLIRLSDLCRELDAEMDGSRVSKTTASILNAIRRVLSELDETDDHSIGKVSE